LYDGYYNFRSRVYNSDIGRFISRDTIGYSGGDSNLFRYSFNSCVNATDPFGTFSFTDYAVLLSVLLVTSDSGPSDSSGSGCGDRNTSFVPDSFLFGAIDFGPACQRHDSCYSTPNASKLTCDLNFLSDMLQSGGGFGFLAYIYFIGVFLGGWGAFNQAQQGA
jgi:hypothetical protein